MRKIIIGVMGPGDDATSENKNQAYELGRLIAQKGWVVLSGGRNVGVMDAVSQGGRSAGGLVVGILPFSNGDQASTAVEIAILTGMGDARNHINVLTSDVLVICGMNPGTASEVGLGLKAKKPMIFLKSDDKSLAFFQALTTEKIFTAQTPLETITLIQKLIKNHRKL